MERRAVWPLAGLLLLVVGTSAMITPAELAEVAKLCNMTFPAPNPEAHAFIGELQYASIPGAEIGYFRFGNKESDKPALILVPGFAGTISGWPVAILKELAEDREVVTMDNKGQGFSTDEDPTVPLTIVGMANDTKNFVETLGLSQPPNLMGLSMGGMITMAAAALYSDSFSHFVMLSGSAGSKHSSRMNPEIREMLLTNEGPAEEFLNMLFPIDNVEGFEAACDFVLNSVNNVVDKANVMVLERQMAAIDEFYNADEVFERLSQTDSPVYIVGGDNDPIVPAFNQKLAAKQLPFPWMTIFKVGAHSTYTEHWNVVHPMLELFFAQGMKA